MPKIREPLIRTLLIIVSLAVAIVIAELVYGAIEPPQDNYLFSDDESPATYYRYHPKLGWENTPGGSGIFVRKEFTTSVSINNEGMRYHAFSSAEHRFHIAVLGDSFAWGNGVEAEERFSDLVEKKLNVGMLNFGVSGYSTVQQYLQLERVLQYKPDLLLLVFCLGNDFADNVVNFRDGHFKPYAALENDALVIKGHPVPNTKDYIVRKRPYAARYALGRFFYLYLFPTWFEAWRNTPQLPHTDLHAEGMVGFKNDEIYHHPDSKVSKQALYTTELVLAEMKQKLDAQKIPFMILAAPTRKEADNPNALNALKTIAERLKIPLLYPNTLSKESFFERDGHWNAVGHARVAEFIIPEIEKYATQK